MEEEITYEQAVAELDRILQTIQSDQCGIDRLTSLTRRAIALLKTCRERLTTTEQELAQILEELAE